MAWVAILAYWVGYRHGSHSSSATLNLTSKLRQIDLAYREDRITASELSPAPPITTESALPYFGLLPRTVLADTSRTSTPLSPKKGIEDAERHNLYEMQKYQRRVLRDIQAQPSSLPTTVTPPVLELEDRR